MISDLYNKYSSGQLDTLDFNVELQKAAATTSATTDTFVILLQGAKEKTSLLGKWSAINVKLK